MFYFYRIIIHPCRLSKTEELHRGSAHLTAAHSVLDQFLHWENVESRLIKCVMSSFSLSLSLRTRSLCVWSLTRPKSTRCWRRWPTSSRASTASFSARKAFPLRRQRGCRRLSTHTLFCWVGFISFSGDTRTWESLGSVFATVDPTWPLLTDKDWTDCNDSGGSVDLLMDQKLFLFCFLKCPRGTWSVSLIPLMIVNEL